MSGTLLATQPLPASATTLDTTLPDPCLRQPSGSGLPPGPPRGRPSLQPGSPGQLSPRGKAPEKKHGRFSSIRELQTNPETNRKDEDNLELQPPPPPKKKKATTKQTTKGANLLPRECLSLSLSLSHSGFRGLGFRVSLSLSLFSLFRSRAGPAPGPPGAALPLALSPGGFFSGFRKAVKKGSIRLEEGLHKAFTKDSIRLEEGLQGFILALRRAFYQPGGQSRVLVWGARLRSSESSPRPDLQEFVEGREEVYVGFPGL